MAKKKGRGQRVPLSSRYQLCKRSDLASFAANRKIAVVSTSHNAEYGPLFLDYVRALRQADIDATFRFLDLLPELRNLVYELLLVCRGSPYCYPQMLATAGRYIRKQQAYSTETTESRSASSIRV